MILEWALDHTWTLNPRGMCPNKGANGTQIEKHHAPNTHTHTPHNVILNNIMHTLAKAICKCHYTEFKMICSKFAALFRLWPAIAVALCMRHKRSHVMCTCTALAALEQWKEQTKTKSTNRSIQFSHTMWWLAGSHLFIFSRPLSLIPFRPPRSHSSCQRSSHSAKSHSIVHCGRAIFISLLADRWYKVLNTVWWIWKIERCQHFYTVNAMRFCVW